jgi:hypothetical protein
MHAHGPGANRIKLRYLIHITAFKLDEHRYLLYVQRLATVLRWNNRITNIRTFVTMRQKLQSVV